ncbi:MAG TPA: hypothetical protein PKI14_00245 [Fervidobacterium sp.]|nr:hypothetical protein [Fervidobacterium sp.]HOQ39086.1 hypothetical protein [Fervidobacterium sp.]HPT53307.1 hypothetical protein [Fervidobacterium sp.]HPZ16919.1 hypothetical protein [Fervidobacterium sp.]HQE47768.1 hypothetical protein [Fervidobacterium sp.]
MQKVRFSKLAIFVIITSVISLFGIDLEALSPSVQGIYNSFSINVWNLSLVYEDSNLAAGLRFYDENLRSESYKLGFITMKRPIDKSYFDVLAFVGWTNGVILTLGYESYSIPTTGFERTYYFSTNQVITTDYSKVWFALPSIPIGGGTVGPFSLNYEGFSLSKIDVTGPSIDLKRGFANIDALQLSFIQLGSIYSLGFFVFPDKSLEQGATINLGWDFDEGKVVGILGGRVFIGFEDFRFFFSAYGTYIPSSSAIKYGVWMRFLSPIQGDLIVQNSSAYFKIKLSE